MKDRAKKVAWFGVVCFILGVIVGMIFMTFAL